MNLAAEEMFKVVKKKKKDVDIDLDNIYDEHSILLKISTFQL